MKHLKTTLMSAGGIGLIFFAGYWYLISHEDLSQFLSFSIIGVLICLFVVVIDEMNKLRQEVDYFDDMMVEEFERKRRIKC